MAGGEWENRLTLAGRLLAPPQVRVSPAGIPIVRLQLEHDSAQLEGGVRRRQRFRIGVRVVGRELCDLLKVLSAGDIVRVTGHLTRSDQRNEDYRLLIAAEALEGPVADDA